MNFKYAKDGITVAVMLDTSHPKLNGLYPVRIRVTYRRVRKYYPTGKDMTAEDWAALPTTKRRDLSAVRKDLENSYNLIRAAVEGLANTGDFSLEALNIRLKLAPSACLNVMFEARIDQLKSAGRWGTFRIWDSTLHSLERFAGKRIQLGAISPDWLKRYAAFMAQEGSGQTTIGMRLQTLRVIINQAKAAGLVKESQYPFGRGRYEIQKGEGRKMALTMEQIGQIARYDDGNEITARCRDYWLFIYLCNGINVADFVRLRYRDIVNGEICFVRQKTEHTTKVRKEIRAIVTEPMQRIIDRWGNPPHPDAFIFPILDGSEDAAAKFRKRHKFIVYINRRLRYIGQQLGIGNISTYTARHSFATVLKRSGANIAYISESLGHSDLKTTENYLASFEREERQKNAELLIKF